MMLFPRKHPLLTAMACVSAFLSGLAAQNAGPQELQSLLAQGKAAEALDQAHNTLAALEADNNAEDVAIALAKIMVGQCAAATGDAELAVAMFEAGLPELSEMRRQRLFLDEFLCATAYIKALQTLDERDKRILPTLEGLLQRARNELNFRREGPNATLTGNTPDGQVVELEAFKSTQGWLIDLLSQIGQHCLATERWARAEEALLEAEALAKAHHPEQEAKIATLREGWEEAARAQGKTVRPQKVGRFSNPRALDFEGNSTFPVSEITRALTRSSRFVLSSHPSEALDPYLEALSGCVRDAYKAQGFRDVIVTADWSHERATVRVSITEGPRFKAGEIRIAGAQLLSEDRLIERLLVKPEGKDTPTLSRGAAFLKSAIAHKRLPSETVLKAMRETFPDLFPAGNPTDLTQLQVFPAPSVSEEDPVGYFWKPGQWVDYRQETLMTTQTSLMERYYEGSRFRPEINVQWAPHEDAKVVDLEIHVKNEGTPLHLGKLHIRGTHSKDNGLLVQTTEAIQAYLDLEEGKALPPNFGDEIKRKLYESARFLAWEVMVHPSPNRPGTLDLLILVAEHWMAPPLSEPLSREQRALGNFARWINEEAGNAEDIVFSVYHDNRHGPIRLTLAMNEREGALTLEGPNSRLLAHAREGEEAHVVALREGKTSFHATFSLAELVLQIYFVMCERFADDSPLKTTSSQLGAFLGTESSSFDTGQSSVGIDLATAMRLASGSAMQFADAGHASIRGGNHTLHFDEASGRLAEFLLRGDAETESPLKRAEIRVSAASGTTQRIRSEIEKLAQESPNWLADRRANSLYFYGLAFTVEFLKELSVPEGGLTDAMAQRLGQRMERWAPLATLLGDVLGSIHDQFSAESETSVFHVPFRAMDASSDLQILNLLLGIGVYEVIANYVEPGTWPDRVTREILFILAGRPKHLGDTIQSLIDDPSMGPLGCLICSRLLVQIGHSGFAYELLQKARRNLHEDGFAKDWALLLPQLGKNGGIAALLAEALGKLKEADLAFLLTEDTPPELIAQLTALKQGLAGLQPELTVESLRPLMNLLWDHLLAEQIGERIDEAEESLINPREIAALVNGDALPRGVLEYRRNEYESMNLPLPSPLESCIADLLAAQEAWKEGKFATPDFMETMAEKAISRLGEDGAEQLEAMGLSRDQLKWWMGVQRAALYQWSHQQKPNQDLTAVVEQETERLREKATIQEFEDPGEEEEETTEELATSAWKQFTAWWNSSSSSDKPSLGSLTPENVEAKAKEGSAEHRYYLGALAEMGRVEPSGMKAARGHYIVAAAAGEVKAMLRLAELYRTGRGTERSAKEEKKWREMAAKAAVVQEDR